MKGVGGGFSSAIFDITTKFTVFYLQYVYSTDITTTTTVQGGAGRQWCQEILPTKYYGKQQLFNTIYSVVYMYGYMNFRQYVL